MSDEWVVLTKAGSAAEARVIEAVLGAAGIPALVEGDTLMDEWAMSQRLMGQIGSDVKVPSSQLEAAQEALEMARASGVGLARMTDAESEEESTPRAGETDADPDEKILDEYRERRRWPFLAIFCVVVFGAAAAVFAVLWMRLDYEVRLYRYEGTHELSWSQSWTRMHRTHKRTGVKTDTYYNSDLDDRWEQYDAHFPNGAVTWQNIDEDEDGYIERTLLKSPHSGEVILEFRDDNRDQFPDAIWIRSEGGVRTYFDDADGDQEFEAPRTVRP